jgi:hypothetical protein
VVEVVTSLAYFSSACVRKESGRREGGECLVACKDDIPTSLPGTPTSLLVCSFMQAHAHARTYCLSLPPKQKGGGTFHEQSTGRAVSRERLGDWDGTDGGLSPLVPAKACHMAKRRVGV